ncbi:hypothetical protein FIBSPDRAFT_935503 [Athelia psychrophila]|uniref:Uncharacterized protein n=1 Tax=Athelia psychrophila TaxID=1759441 RepID=A0A166DR92_9AGAM|nr:hypothetical protein FIBSPDRAFT_935503 [Fibularhizoctonia sp. CBS 109695]
MSSVPSGSSPTEQELVDTIILTVRTLGVHTGIPKIHEHIKDARPEWVLSEKRVRDTRRKYDLVEFVSDTDTSKKPSSIVLSSGASLAAGASLTMFHLDYLLTGDGAVVRFIEAIPTAYCVPEPPEEATRFLNILTETHDAEVLRRWDSTCPWCARRAQAMYSAMALLLHGTLVTPTVLVTALPLCSSEGVCFGRASAFMPPTPQEPDSSA